MDKVFVTCRRLCCNRASTRWCAHFKPFTNANVAVRTSTHEASSVRANPRKSLDEDTSWEAEVLRHEKLVNSMKDKNSDQVPVSEGEQKVNQLPHTAFRSKEDFEKQNSMLSETSQMLLGKVIEQISDACLSNHTNLDQVFMRKEVQTILQRLHYSGVDFDKACRLQMREREVMPSLRYLTEEQLQQEMSNAREKMLKKLEMIPVFIERSPCESVLSEDTILDGHEQSNVSFVDISDDLTPRERFVVIREPNGILRKANWKERDRLMQTYYPKPHRKIVPPSLLRSENLKNAFSMDLHENVLDQCVVQFDPDSKEFIEIFSAVYEDIDKKELYETLGSTRYFGGFVYHLAKTANIDGILLHMLQNDRLEDACDCVNLFLLTHPDRRNKETTDDSVSLVEAYIKLYSKNSPTLLKALKSCKLPGDNKSD